MKSPTVPAPPTGMNTFLIVWVGQLISLLGSGLTGFALGLWVLERSGSVTQFAFISFCAVAPAVLLSPLAGALVDRWDRRWLMLASEIGGGIVTLVLALLLHVNHLEIWQVYAATLFIATLAAFQFPAFSASTTLLVPKEHLANASGLVQMAQGVARTAAPVIAGIMISAKTLGIQSVLLADATSYVFGAVTLFSVRFPILRQINLTSKTASLWRDIRDGWSYLRQKPGLVALMLFLAAINLVMGTIIVLVTPLVLSFSNANVLGKIMSTAGIGMFVGSVVISVWGGPKRRMSAVYGFLLLCGVALLPAALPASTATIGAGAFFFMLGVPIVNGCIQACMQCKVKPEIQGRVFATMGMLTASALPLAYAMAGPLADRVFEPALSQGGAWATTIGSIIGTGPGRGVALIFVISGLALLALTIAGIFYRPLRMIEDELPDALTNEAPAALNTAEAA